MEGNPVFFQVDLPDGSWKLAALPAEGWTAAVERPLLQFRGLTLAIAFLIALLIGLAVGYRTHLTLAVRQRTDSLQRSLTDRREAEEKLNRTLDNLRQAMGATLQDTGPGGRNERSLLGRTSEKGGGPGADDRDGDGAFR